MYFNVFLVLPLTRYFTLGSTWAGGLLAPRLGRVWALAAETAPEPREVPGGRGARLPLGAPGRAADPFPAEGRPRKGATDEGPESTGRGSGLARRTG